jgi:hypothetical protein
MINQLCRSRVQSLGSEIAADTSPNCHSARGRMQTLRQAGEESVSQPPLKDQALSTFLERNPRFELRPENGNEEQKLLLMESEPCPDRPATGPRSTVSGRLPPISSLSGLGGKPTVGASLDVRQVHRQARRARPASPSRPGTSFRRLSTR